MFFLHMDPVPLSTVSLEITVLAFVDMNFPKAGVIVFCDHVKLHGRYSTFRMISTMRTDIFFISMYSST